MQRQLPETREKTLQRAQSGEQRISGEEDVESLIQGIVALWKRIGNKEEHVKAFVESITEEQVEVLRAAVKRADATRARDEHTLSQEELSNTYRGIGYWQTQ